MSKAVLTPEQIKLVNLLNQFFMPVKEASADQQFYTTLDVYRKLQSLWPSDAYTTEDVLQVLIYLEYVTVDSSSDKVFWMMRFKY